MASEYFGVVYEIATREIRMVVNPDVDAQLDDPSFITADGEQRAMLKIRRNVLDGATDIATIIKISRKTLQAGDQG